MQNVAPKNVFTTARLPNWQQRAGNEFPNISQVMWIVNEMWIFGWYVGSSEKYVHYVYIYISYKIANASNPFPLSDWSYPRFPWLSMKLTGDNRGLLLSLPPPERPWETHVFCCMAQKCRTKIGWLWKYMIKRCGSWYSKLAPHTQISKHSTSTQNRP